MSSSSSSSFCHHDRTGSHTTSDSTAPVFSMDQVTALIQQMKEEQALLLQNQREMIVKQVLEQLHTSSDTQPQLQQQSLSPARRLEKNLHQLVVHSLEESGLDFPHVHTKNYAPFPSHHHPLANNLSSTRPKTAVIIDVQASGTGSSSPSKTNLILMRPEPVEMTIEARRVDELRPNSTITMNSETATMSPMLAKSASDQMLTSQSKQKAHSKMLDASPLRTPKRKNTPQKFREKVNSRRRAMRRFASGEEDEDDDDEEEEQENDSTSTSFRRSIDHKTMAILEKSKALLQDTKRQGNTSKTPNKKNLQLALEDSTVFDDTSQDQQQDKEAPPPSIPRPPQQPQQQMKEQNTPTSIQKEKEKKKSKERSSEVQSPTVAPVHVAPQSPVPVRAPSPPKEILEQVHQEMEQVELLRAPEHPPENENEWENELARQILTIYATSVKAKAALQAQAQAQAQGQTQIQDRAATNGVVPGTTTTMLPSLRLPPSKSPTNRLSTASNCRFGVGSGSVGSTTLPSTTLPPGSHHSVHHSWEPSHLRDDGKVIINLPKIPKPVWFAGTGAVKAVWCALAQGFQDLHESQEAEKDQKPIKSSTAAICEHRLCEQVRQMEAELKFSKCITTIETLLLALVRARGLVVGELEEKLWKQLVVTCNAFASRAIDYKKFTLALELLKQAEQLIQNSILVTENSRMRMELMAFVYDTYAHYYYQRRKPSAAFQYLKKAQDIHTRHSSWSHIAKCRLHIANVLNFQGKHVQSLEMLASILQLIEDNRLEENISGGGGGSGAAASAQKICLASVCYNNLAIEQLHLREFENAHISCGNGKRLAKLCLSYSNRWLSQFEATGKCVALAIATLMEDVNNNNTTTNKPTSNTTNTINSCTNGFGAIDERARIAAVTNDF